MKEQIIEIFKNYKIDKKVIDDFFKYQNIGDEKRKKVMTKVITYPLCDLDFIGAYPKVDNNILIDYKLRLPKATDIYSSLIYIHEIIHGLILQDNINTNFKEDIFEEVLPMLYEDLFINYLVEEYGYDIKDLYNEYTLLRFKDPNINYKYFIARLIINNYYSSEKEGAKKLINKL